MPDLRDPSSLMRHAEEAGDFALIALIADRLTGRTFGGPAARAFLVLVHALEIGGVCADEFSDE